MIKYAVLLVLLFQYAQSHTYHTGGCPSVEPMAGFDIKQVNLLNNKRTEKVISGVHRTVIDRQH